MEIFLEILKIILPSVIVFITALYVLKTVLQKDAEKRKVEIILQNQKMITPLRLQAYERMVLFLERISPNNIIMRLQTPNMTAAQLHKEMLILIRSEFEHNLSQQIYLSIDSWEQIKIAKEKTIQLLNAAFNNLEPDANAMLFSQLIFEKLIVNQKSPLQEAIDYLKNEIKILY